MIDPELSGDLTDDGHGGAPWMVFADLTAAVLGVFALLFVWVVVFRAEAAADLEAERGARIAAEAAQTQAEAARAQAQAAAAALTAEKAAAQAKMAGLESAFASAIATGRVTFSDGRIGIAGRLLFDLYSAALSPEGHALLREVAGPLAAWLQKHDEMVMVGGFTDDLPITGEDRRFEDNWQLSTERALTVVRALVAAGVPPERLYAAGFGAHHPEVANADDASRARNRRVEIVPQRRR